VVISAVRTVFHWHDNYIRFSAARETVEAERRMFHTSAAPYDDPSTRDQVLVARVSQIEREEMTGWTKVAIERPRT
jgi:hypothetical protein